MNDSKKESANVSIAKIEGKSTPFGFNINLEKSLPRNTYLSTNHEDKTFILGIEKLWNDHDGNHAKVSVIGETPRTPFNINCKIFIATHDQIENSLGLKNTEDQALHLGKILYTNIDATPNVGQLGRLFITGKSGSGKSYTVGIIIEELLKKKIPVIIIDRHGEYSTLKILQKENIPENESYFNKNDPDKLYAQSIIEFADLTINAAADLDIKYLISTDITDLIAPGQCINVNLAGLDIPLQEKIVHNFCYNLYKASTKREIPPHYIFIDEAHLFAGKKKTEIRETLKLSAQEGRKFGHNLVVITQKPQLLDVTIRSQAGSWIIHKLTDFNDVKATLNSTEGLNNDDYEEIQSFSRGEAIITGELAPLYPIRIKFRKRYTVHGGSGVNILDYIKKGEVIPKSKLVDRIKNSISIEMIEKTSEEIFSKEKINPLDLISQLNNLRKENLELKQNLADLNSKNHTTKINSKDKILLNIPKPGEMYDDKMLEVMETRDDITIQLQETIDDRDSIQVKYQTLELEMSGVKVENEDLKDRLEKEQTRADEAVSLAERCVSAMKKKKK